MMPTGPILLLILLVMALFGLLDGALQRLSLGSRTAVPIIAVMLLGCAVEIPLTSGLSINLGAGLLPTLFALIYIAITTERAAQVRALLAAAAAAGAVWMVSRWFPPGQPTELNLFYLDAEYLYGVVAGACGYLMARSPGAALCAAILGVMLAELADYAQFLPGAPPAEVRISLGGGVLGATLLAGTLAFILTAWTEERTMTLQSHSELNYR